MNNEGSYYCYYCYCYYYCCYYYYRCCCYYYCYCCYYYYYYYYCYWKGVWDEKASETLDATRISKYADTRTIKR